MSENSVIFVVFLIFMLCNSIINIFKLKQKKNDEKDITKKEIIFKKINIIVQNENLE